MQIIDDFFHPNYSPAILKLIEETRDDLSGKVEEIFLKEIVRKKVALFIELAKKELT